MLLSSVIFPNLGITIENLVQSFTIFGYRIAWYGVIIACAMIFAVILTMFLAKKTNQDPDDYIDVAIWSIIFGIIGARAYYVIFSWDEYKDNLIQVFNVRAGGLAIYGGLIAGIITAVVVCKIKKISFLRVFDTAAPGIVLAQAIGRWGNFFNMEAYGGYTDSLFAMQLNYSEANGVITDELIDNLVTIDEISYIQVHPTFLYESMWCLVVGILILIFRRFQKYDGEVLLWYIGGYALGRSWIEGLRTDQLLIGNSGIAVSQLLSIALVAGALALLIINRVRLATKQWVPAFSRVLEDGAPGTVQFTQAKADARKAKRAAKKGTDSIETQGEETEGGSAAEETERALPEGSAEEEAGIASETEGGEIIEGDEEAGGEAEAESEEDGEGAFESDTEEACAPESGDDIIEELAGSEETQTQEAEEPEDEDADLPEDIKEALAGEIVKEVAEGENKEELV